jgi:hypothetical protein
MFNNAKKEVLKAAAKAAGIYDTKVTKVTFHEAGTPLEGNTELKGKKSEDMNFITLTLEITKAIVSRTEEVGKLVEVNLLEPTGDKINDRITRLANIAKKFWGKDAEEAKFAEIQNLKTFKDLFDFINDGKDKTIRFKFAQSGQYAEVPGYYNGISECTDAPSAMRMADSDWPVVVESVATQTVVVADAHDYSENTEEPNF